MHQLYNLVGHHAMPVDPDEFIPVEAAASRVGYTEIPTEHGNIVEVSTVFLGVDHRSERQIANHDPVRLFETRVTLRRGRGTRARAEDPADYYATYLWPTWEIAQTEHEAAARLLIARTRPHPHGDTDHEIVLVFALVLAGAAFLACAVWGGMQWATGRIFGEPLTLTSVLAVYLVGWAAAYAFDALMTSPIRER